MYSAADFLINDNAGNAESSGTNYDNDVMSFTNVVVTVYPN